MAADQEKIVDHIQITWHDVREREIFATEEDAEDEVSEFQVLHAIMIGYQNEPVFFKILMAAADEK